MHSGIVPTAPSYLPDPEIGAAGLPTGQDHVAAQSQAQSQAGTLPSVSQGQPGGTSRFLSLISRTRANAATATAYSGPAVLSADDAASAALRHLHGLSGRVRDRYGLGAGLIRHKPSSPRLWEAKHCFTAIQRDEMTNVLMQHIRNPQIGEQDKRQLTDLFLCLQHARLRTHTPVARSEYRREFIRHGFRSAGVTVGKFIATAGIVTLADITLSIEKSAKMYRNYYRSEGADRPEYAQGVNDMMSMLRHDIPQSIKRKIAGEILDCFIREKLLTPVDKNRIALAVEGSHEIGDTFIQYDDLQKREEFARSVLPGLATEEQQDRLIAWAEALGEDANHWSLQRYEELNRGYLNRNALNRQNLNLQNASHQIFEQQTLNEEYPVQKWQEALNSSGNAPDRPGQDEIAPSVPDYAPEHPTRVELPPGAR